MPQVTLRLVTIDNYHEIIPKYITEKEIIISDYDDMTNCILRMIREGYCFNMDKNLLRGFLEDLTYMFSPNDDKNKDRIVNMLEESDDSDSDSDTFGTIKSEIVKVIHIRKRQRYSEICNQIL